MRLRIEFAIRSGRAEAALAASAESATHRRARARDEVLAVVSHDLRGPPLRDQRRAPRPCAIVTGAVGTRYLGAIERASDRAERLIADLLEASAIENGGLDSTSWRHRRRGDRATSRGRSRARHQRSRWHDRSAESPPNRIVVRADRDRVLQVPFGNLIGNAIKHARATPIELTLEITDQEARIGVRDRGPTIGATHELPHTCSIATDRGRSKTCAPGPGAAGSPRASSVRTASNTSRVALRRRRSVRSRCRYRQSPVISFHRVAAPRIFVDDLAEAVEVGPTRMRYFAYLMLRSTSTESPMVGYVGPVTKLATPAPMCATIGPSLTFGAPPAAARPPLLPPAGFARPGAKAGSPWDRGE